MKTVVDSQESTSVTKSYVSIGGRTEEVFGYLEQQLVWKGEEVALCGPRISQTKTSQIRVQHLCRHILRTIVRFKLEDLFFSEMVLT